MAMQQSMTPLSSIFKCPCSRLSFAHSLCNTAPSVFFRSRGQAGGGATRGVTTCAVGVPAKNWTAGVNTPKEWQWTPHREPRRPGEKRKKIPMPRPKKERVLLRPPMDDTRLAEKLLNSPQLTLTSFPLLSSCLPPAPLNQWDEAWMEEYLLEAKDALGLAGFEAEEGIPGAQLDNLLYLAFQHPDSTRGKRAPYVRNGHTRLAFLGEYVLELGMTEMVLQIFPREMTGSLRERVFGLINKKILPTWLHSASMDRLVYPDGDWETVRWNDKVKPCKSVFYALIAAVYLTLGMPEVFRVLFEVFGFDVDAPECQPKPRGNFEDVDHLSSELDGERLTWQDIAYYQAPEGALFSEPRLFRACVPPGMHRFRNNLWEAESLPVVKKALGYPQFVRDDNPEVTAARNIELDLGLQLCFLHPSTYKTEHPRFCYERLEYLGSKVQDVIMAEKILLKYLDAPGQWIEERHRKILLNRVCGLYLRNLKLHYHIVYSDERHEVFAKARKLRNFATTGVSQALHGLGYTVYGRPEVRRLMFRVMNFEQLESPIE
ncbi:hypothetical protein KC19_VG227600 [Ceratodon purpureus]|uniref:RNase III domain-containing protein n=1 Tax=Ceratodon purpureus TaxID=3225 RepID=A0A8T0HSL2_CERPU|nr:hypothetical protein KC19_VG227600 [Ceratodon purpureus]